jgi:Ca2+-dependent lipid-binding protein
MQIVVYPNQIPVPLMENSGLPKPPSGMLELTVQRCSNLRSKDLVGKGDPFVKVSVLTMGTMTDKHGKEHPMVAHEDPPHTTAVKSGKDPVFNERFKVQLRLVAACMPSVAVGAW